MSILEVPAIQVGLIVILLTGFVSACAARLSVGTRRQTVYQSLFFFCLTLVGGVMIASLGLAPGFWVVPAIVFSIMVLLVTCDFGQSQKATVF